MGLPIASEQGVQHASAVMAAGSAAGAALAFVKEWAAELFGVSLPVLLAAETGAFGARSFMPPVGIVRAFVGAQAWAFIGAFGADGLRALVAGATGFTLPGGTMPLAALLIAGGLQLLLTAELIAKARAAVGRRIDSLWNKGGPDA